MLLQRFSEMKAARQPVTSFVGLLGFALLVAGCAGGPSTKPSTANAEPGDETAEIREVPPEAQTLYEQATAVMAAGDLVEAEFRFQEFVLQYPDYPGAHVNLAILHSGNGNEKAAEDSITDALLLDSEYAPALNQLGMLLRRQGKFDDAEAAYLRAIDKQPDYALAHYNLGVLNELYLQRLGPALSHFERYQALTGEDKQVEKWIVDLKRRLEASQRAANVTE